VRGRAKSSEKPNVVFSPFLIARDNAITLRCFRTDAAGKEDSFPEQQTLPEEFNAEVKMGDERTGRIHHKNAGTRVIEGTSAWVVGTHGAQWTIGSVDAHFDRQKGRAHIRGRQHQGNSSDHTRQAGIQGLADQWCAHPPSSGVQMGNFWTRDVRDMTVIIQTGLSFTIQCQQGDSS